MVNKQSNASQSAHYLQEHGRELKYQEPFSRVADCIFKICRKVRRRECGIIHLGTCVCVWRVWSLGECVCVWRGAALCASVCESRAFWLLWLQLVSLVPPSPPPRCAICTHL